MINYNWGNEVTPIRPISASNLARRRDQTQGSNSPLKEAGALPAKKLELSDSDDLVKDRILLCSNRRFDRLNIYRRGWRVLAHPSSAGILPMPIRLRILHFLVPSYLVGEWYRR